MEDEPGGPDDDLGAVGVTGDKKAAADRQVGREQAAGRGLAEVWVGAEGC